MDRDLSLARAKTLETLIASVFTNNEASSAKDYRSKLNQMPSAGSTNLISVKCDDPSSISMFNPLFSLPSSEQLDRLYYHTIFLSVLN